MNYKSALNKDVHNAHYNKKVLVPFFISAFLHNVILKKKKKKKKNTDAL